jgi:hypothetical protein
MSVYSIYCRMAKRLAPLFADHAARVRSPVPVTLSAETWLFLSAFIETDVA